MLQNALRVTIDLNQSLMSTALRATNDKNSPMDIADFTPENDIEIVGYRSQV